jgi:NAD+ synthase
VTATGANCPDVTGLLPVSFLRPYEDLTRTVRIDAIERRRMRDCRTARGGAVEVWRLLERALMSFDAGVLAIDADAITRDIESALRRDVISTFRRKGIVVGLSGGVDSSVVAALSARALGRAQVLALLMPERDSSPTSLELGKLVADHFGIPVVVEDLAAALEALGCYRRQDEAIRSVFPDYDPTRGYRCKLTLPSVVESDRLSVFTLTVRAPDGRERSSRMTPDAYRQLVAATNFKQRLRKTMEYYHADRLGYVVGGTPNRLEYDQGFFVKQGDGAADVKPIAHLYKTQVYALAAHLGVPEIVRTRPPTTDTFSMDQTQEEFYFALPYDKMDLCLWAKNHGRRPDEVAPAIGLTGAQVERVFRDIDAKRRATRYMHARPLLVEPVREIEV